MRGNVLMWSGDKGVVSSGGQRYDFNINQWKGDQAPAANSTVEITVNNGVLESVAPVNEADLAKEKMAELTGTLHDAGFLQRLAALEKKD